MSLPIAVTALRSIDSVIRASDPRLETGGALFGPRDGSTVLHASEPGPLAEHSDRFFHRDLAFTEQEAQRLYWADGSHWVGEWHTHVDGPPTPSPFDLHTYAKHLTDPDLGFERFIALVVASPQNHPIFATWVLERCGGQLMLMQMGSEPLHLT